MFENSSLKIERGREHIASLEQEFNNFVDRKPYKLTCDKDSVTGGYVLNAAQIESLPRRFSSIIGDAIHNLRSSLDLMACDLVRKQNQSVEHVGFIVSKSDSSFDNQLKNTRVSVAGPSVVKKLREWQPYNKGTVDLSVLHELDIRDKHRGVIAILDEAHIQWTASWTETSVLHGKPVTNTRIHTSTGRLRDGEAVPNFPSVMVKGDWYPPSISLIFEDDNLLADKEIFATLRRFADLVEQIVADFQSLG